MRIPISIEFVSIMQVSRTGPSVRLNSARIHKQTLRATSYCKPRSPSSMELQGFDIEETPYWILLGCRKNTHKISMIPTGSIAVYRCAEPGTRDADLPRETCGVEASSHIHVADQEGP